MTDAEWQALMDQIRAGIEDIRARSGFGCVAITCQNGMPFEVRISQTLRFQRDVARDEVKSPQA